MFKNSLVRKLASLIVCGAFMLVSMLPAFASQGNDATLSYLGFADLIVDLTKSDSAGKALAENATGFSPEHTNYLAHFPYNMETDSYYVPEVEAVSTDSNATVAVNVPADISAGSITVVVTAANGVAQQTYQITPELTGENLFVEGDFETPGLSNVTGGSGTSLVRNNMSVWKSTLGTTKVFLSEDAADGEHAMKIDRGMSSNACWEGYVKEDSATTGNYTLVKDKRYYVSVQTKLDNSATVDQSATQHLYMGSKEGWGTNTANVVAYDDNFNSLNSNVGSVTLNKTDWHTYTSIIVPQLDSWQTDVRIIGAGSLQPIVVDNYFVGELAVGKIAVTDKSGSDTAGVPVGETKTINLTAKALNQYGNSAGLEALTSATWSVAGNPQGISVNNGLVTLDGTTPAGSYRIEAVMDSSSAVTNGQGMVKGVYTVKVSVGSLSAIEVSAPAVIDFSKGKLTYDLYVPAKHIDGNDVYTMPVVNAVAEDENNNVTIKYPEKIENGSVIEIEVTDRNGKEVDVYTLNLKPVGGNLFVDGNFEDASSVGHWEVISGNVKFSQTTESVYGTGGLRIEGGGGSGLGWQGDVITGDGVPTSSSRSLKSGKNYYMSVMAKIASDVETVSNGTRTTFYHFTTNNWNAQPGTMKGYDNGVYRNAPESTTWLLKDNWYHYENIIVPSSDEWKTLATLSNASSNAEALVMDDYFLGELAVSEVKVTDENGSDFALVSVGESKDVNLTAKALNQNGNGVGLESMTEISWSVAGNPVGITVANGKVTIGDTVAPGSYEVVALMDATGVVTNGQTKVKGVYNIVVSDGTLLKSLEVSGPTILEYAEGTLSYELAIPAKHIGGTDVCTMPEVTATVAEGYEAEIVYPEKVENGSAIVINVIDINGKLSDIYSINLKPVGGNLFVDGGFETSTSATENWTFNNTTPSFTSDAAHGSRAMLIPAGTGGVGWKGKVKTGTGMPTASNETLGSGKTYYMSAMAKIPDNTTITSSLDRNTYYNFPLPSWTEQKAMYAYDADGNPVIKADGSHDFYSVHSFIDHNWHTYTNIIIPNGSWTTHGTISNASTNSGGIIVDDYFLGELVVTDVKVTAKDGNSETERPADGRIELSAKLLNQFGNGAGLENETVVLSLADGAPKGISLANGVLTVPAGFIGDVTIEAESTLQFAGHAQNKVKGKTTITVTGNGFMFLINDEQVTEVSAGTIVNTVTFKNSLGLDVDVDYIVALYEKTTGGVYKLASVNTYKTSTVKSGETLSDSQTITVPSDGKEYAVKSFLWKKDTFEPLIASAVLN